MGGEDYVGALDEAAVADEAAELLDALFAGGDGGVVFRVFGLLDVAYDLAADDAGAVLLEDALVFEDIEAEGADLAGLEGLDEGVCVDEAAAGCIDEDDAGFAEGEGFAVDDVAGLGEEGDIEGDDVGAAEELLEGDVLEVEGGGDEGLGFYVVCEDFHAEAAGDADGVEAYAAGADDADGFAHEVEAAKGLV